MNNDKFYFVDFKKHISSLTKDSNADVLLCVKSIELFDEKEYLYIINNSELNALLEILARFVVNNGITQANKKTAETV